MAQRLSTVTPGPGIESRVGPLRGACSSLCLRLPLCVLPGPRGPPGEPPTLGTHAPARRTAVTQRRRLARVTRRERGGAGAGAGPGGVAAVARSGLVQGPALRGARAPTTARRRGGPRRASRGGDAGRSCRREPGGGGGSDVTLPRSRGWGPAEPGAADGKARRAVGGRRFFNI